jgi:hypothetical protein
LFVTLAKRIKAGVIVKRRHGLDEVELDVKRIKAAATMKRVGIKSNQDSYRRRPFGANFTPLID